MKSSVGIFTVLLACGAEPSAGPPASVDLPEGVAARVGEETIDVKAVLEIASANRTESDVARARAISDALFASEARARLSPAEVQSITRAALGRALLEELAHEAERVPITEEEVDKMTRERWLELDRPESARVSHAVALHGKDPAAAKRVAEAIREAVKGLREPSKFLEQAQAVPHSGVDVRAERLPAMTADGRAVVLDRAEGRGSHFDPIFAAAANALEKPGDQSALVETPFGFHVLLLEARLPGVKLPLADRRRVLEKEILAKRAGEKRRALIEDLKKQSRVEIARDFDARTAGLGER